MFFDEKLFAKAIADATGHLFPNFICIEILALESLCQAPPKATIARRSVFLHESGIVRLETTTVRLSMILILSLKTPCT